MTTSTQETPVAETALPNSSANATRPPKISYLPILFAVSTLLICWFILMQIQRNTVEIPDRTPKKFILGEGFAGKVRIYYNIENAEPLRKEDGYWLIPVPFNGEVRTSTPLDWGKAVDEIYVQHRNEKGELVQQRRNFSAAEIHKTGLLGDDQEYFDELNKDQELNLRDPKYIEAYEANREKIQAEMTKGVTVIDYPAYELLLIRDGL